MFVIFASKVSLKRLSCSLRRLIHILLTFAHFTTFEEYIILQGKNSRKLKEFSSLSLHIWLSLYDNIISQEGPLTTKTVAKTLAVTTVNY